MTSAGDMPAPAEPVVRFGAFDVDLRSGELRKSGVRIRIQEQPFRILTALLDRPGDIVTREELREILWPGDTFVDFDHSLNAAVNKLRELLGDSAAHPLFIETLPRRGYRFVYPVHRQDGLSARSAASDPEAATSRGRSRRRAGWVILAAAVLAAALAVALKRTAAPKASPARASAPLSAVPLTSFPGLEANPSFSPDGSQIAFSWAGANQDNVDIYLTVRGGAEPRRLTDSPQEDYSPAWSPDGRWIAFLRQLGDRESEIRLISPLGGAETRLGQVVTGYLTSWWPMQGPVLAWSPDGKWLAVQDQESIGKPIHLALLSVESGERRQLTEPASALWRLLSRVLTRRSNDGVCKGGRFRIPSAGTSARRGFPTAGRTARADLRRGGENRPGVQRRRGTRDLQCRITGRLQLMESMGSGRQRNLSTATLGIGRHFAHCFPPGASPGVPPRDAAVERPPHRTHGSWGVWRAVDLDPLHAPDCRPAVFARRRQDRLRIESFRGFRDLGCEQRRQRIPQPDFAPGTGGGLAKLVAGRHDHRFRRV